jgi:catechol 2,3-dioxygenase-like lactoylglutathione lyase family enzyme
MAPDPDAAAAPAAVSGACLCGAVRFQVELPTLFCVHCHCSMCRRNHGAAFVTWFGVPRERLRIESGADALRRYRSSSRGERSFCERCGSSLFCESERHPDHVDVVLASLAGPIDRAPSAHVYFDSRAHWTDLRDDLPRLGGASGMDALTGADGEIRPGVWVGHVALAAPDPLAAAGFFETLGMRVLQRGPDFALLELRGGTHLALFPAAAAAPGTVAPFDLMVDDLDAAHARFAAAELAPSAIESNTFHRMFTLAAPSGHVLTVQSSHASGRLV